MPDARIKRGAESEQQAQNDDDGSVHASASAVFSEDCRPSLSSCAPVSKLLPAVRETGAGEGIRTLDPNLGKVVLWGPRGVARVHSVRNQAFLKRDLSKNGADLVLT